jgi:hypothetical protein
MLESCPSAIGSDRPCGRLRMEKEKKKKKERGIEAWAEHSCGFLGSFGTYMWPRGLHDTPCTVLGRSRVWVVNRGRD